VLVWFEFSELCKSDPAVFESGQNEFLRRLAEKFDFKIEAITWKEVMELSDDESNTFHYSAR
jgi:hypothetical protein